MNTSISKSILILLILHLTLSCPFCCLRMRVRRATRLNYIRNPRFSYPKIPILKSTISFLGKIRGSWFTADLLYLTKYRKPYTLFFRQALLLNHTSSISQHFDLQTPKGVDITILYTTKNCRQENTEVVVLLNKNLLGNLEMGEGSVKNGIFRHKTQSDKNNKLAITVTKMETQMCRLLIKEVKVSESACLSY